MKTTSTILILAFLFSIFYLSSCQKSLEDQDIQYIGTWSSDDHSIEIYKNGRGVFQKQNQDAIECDVKIEDNRIKFRNGVFRTFDITSTPSTDNEGQTTMFLDNIIFYKH
jgi:hypothetical protein